jgi:hypothetical protein
MFEMPSSIAMSMEKKKDLKTKSTEIQSKHMHKNEIYDGRMQPSSRMLQLSA